MPISPVSIGSPDAPEEFDVQEYELQDSERSNPSDQENIQDDQQRPRVYVDLSQPDDDEDFFDQISENNVPLPIGGVRPPSALQNLIPANKQHNLIQNIKSNSKKNRAAEFQELNKNINTQIKFWIDSELPESLVPADRKTKNDDG